MIEPILPASYAAATIGKLATATGIAGFAGLAFAILAFLFGRAFGRCSDALVALTSVLSAGLAMLLFPEHRALDAEVASLAFGAAVLGGFIAAFGSILGATGAATWFRAQLFVAAGYGLVGIWLILLNVAGGAAHTFLNRAVNMGLFAGAVMVLGFAAIPGILSGADSDRSGPWLSRYVGRAGYLGWLVLFPIWCLWLGQSRLPH